MFVVPRRALSTFRPSYMILQDRKNRVRGTLVSQEQTMYILGQVFNKEAFQLLVRLKYGFLKLQEFDQNIRKIHFKETELEVESKFGSFTFQSLQSMHTLYYTSPFSGVYKYYYDLESKRWVSNKDLHILEENLSRETNKYFKGYLDI